VTIHPRLPDLVLNNLRIIWRPELVLLVDATDPSTHHTLHFGTNSGVLDIHRTRQGPGGSHSHETILAISHKKLVAICADAGPRLLEILSSAAVPFSRAMMRRPGVTVVGGVPLAPESFFAISNVRRGRLEPDLKKMRARLWAACSYEELQSIAADEFFAVVGRRRNMKPRMIGYGFSVKARVGEKRLAWIPSTRMDRAIVRGQTALADSAHRHGVNLWA